ncbi:MAG TPA: Na+/H+ antiporter subunit E [Caulobacteraceae bacterium]|nr:Na+/H+ antiporter subunit E [Caulobacteraceae bacterium]
MTSSGDGEHPSEATPVDASAVDARAVRAGLPVAAIWRAALFLGVWIVMAGAHVADLPAAVAAVALATWASLRLLPPTGSRLSAAGLARLVLVFLYESIVAGVEVARRALHPRLPLRPGFVTYPIGFPPGGARNVFTTLTSLLPGTVPAADEGRELVYHCLDLDQPVLAQLAAEEAILARTLRRGGDAG